MIVVSLLLVGVAAVLLVLGLWQPSDALLSGSIGASVLAAVLLVVNARRSGRPGGLEGLEGLAGTEDVGADVPPPAVGASDGAGMPSGDRDHAPAGMRGDLGEPAGTAPGEVATTVIPQQGATAPAGQPDEPAAVEVEPPDEPAVQQVSAADAERVGRMSTEVLVIDGRPRYHLPGCVHLLGRDSEPLPVSEALELGFTPCALCEPDSALLADAPRV